MTTCYTNIINLSYVKYGDNHDNDWHNYALCGLSNSKGVSLLETACLYASLKHKEIKCNLQKLYSLDNIILFFHKQDCDEFLARNKYETATFTTGRQALEEKLEADFQEKVKLLKGRPVVLHFSTGASSIASYLRLREYDIEPILIYDYFLPDLQMVKNYLDYFQKKFNVRVYQLMSSLGMVHLCNAFLEHGGFKMWEYSNKGVNGGRARYAWRIDFINQLIDGIVGKDTVHVLGLRYSGGLFRKLSLDKYGVFHKNNFMPVGSFTQTDVKDIIKKHDVKLPIEYQYWGISFLGPRVWNINHIRDNCPVTYQQIKDVYPQIDNLGERKGYSTRHFDSRVTSYKGMSISKGAYDKW